jgi:hypothetical protein
MSLLDHFAGLALVGLLAFPTSSDRQLTPQEAAIDAFNTAEAMIAERAKRGL